MNQKEDGITFQGVVSAVLAGALIGYVAYEKLGLRQILDKFDAEHIQQCGFDNERCPPPDDFFPLPPGIWGR